MSTNLDLNPIEARILSKLVKQALKQDYVISVHDGYELAVKRSSSYRDVMTSLGATGMDSIIIRDTFGNRIGTVFCVYGNEPYEVISDYSAASDESLDQFTNWIKPITDYAASFDK